ncbi:hypothetical protein D4768_11240 [Rhodococcus erythropolis]|nr:hypothetical protein D4768_11240 [Rhodococcus erythropolis]
MFGHQLSDCSVYFILHHQVRRKVLWEQCQQFDISPNVVSVVTPILSRTNQPHNYRRGCSYNTHDNCNGAIHV